MAKSARFLLILAALVIGLGVALFADPEYRIHGWFNRESVFQNRYVSAWARDLAGDDARRSEAVGKLQEGNADALPVLLLLAEVNQPISVRLAAVELIGKLGPDGKPAGSMLCRTLNQAPNDLQLIKLIAQTIGKIQPEPALAIPALVERFPLIEAIRAVSVYKAAGKEAIPKLVEHLNHSDTSVRWNVTRTLGKIGPDSLSTLPEILKQLNDPDPAIREHAAEAIGDIGPVAASAIPELVRMLKDPDAKVRKDSVRSLGQMGAAAKSVIAEVTAMKKDPDKLVVDYATNAERLIDPSLAGKGNEGRGPKQKD